MTQMLKSNALRKIVPSLRRTVGFAEADLYNIKENNGNPRILTLQNHQPKFEVSRLE